MPVTAKVPLTWRVPLVATPVVEAACRKAMIWLALLATGGTVNRSNALGRSFAKIAYVGHSLGSVLGAAIVRTYPSDADALVLTGYSTAFATTAIAAQAYASGALFSPSRFGSVLPPGHVVTTIEAERSRSGSAFYGSAFDTDVARADFARQDTAAVGEFAALPDLLLGGGGGTAAVVYTGAVFVATTGQLDAVFCVPSAGRACADILEVTVRVFPQPRRTGPTPRRIRATCSACTTRRRPRFARCTSFWKGFCEGGWRVFVWVGIWRSWVGAWCDITSYAHVIACWY
ncbi:hypothetical protein B0T26DRAFT_229049 [Lasiosphaeria miniovina]|uniref:Uncharacterized protein n=1 Tax=Lasiosphaeria miniovina TaxID=1954250 RepID=A0AA40E3G7_9PEZI|nr:uncharacterized protein B0T26DRAFT_229049 [Lasiosphaeria miniovina]KAK0722691.1 hypothetical protein B0T26DRAFT_229049 [Lasiosphaeria miniovina]